MVGWYPKNIAMCWFGSANGVDQVDHFQILQEIADGLGTVMHHFPSLHHPVISSSIGKLYHIQII